MAIRLSKSAARALGVTMPKAGKRGGKSKLVSEVLRQIELAGLPKPVEEYRFHPTRKWRLDLAYPLTKPPLGIEIHGGIWLPQHGGKGRHTTAKGFMEDCVKRNELGRLGWRLIEICDVHINSLQALKWIEDALESME